MENKLEISVGDGNHQPPDKRNCIPIELLLCTDSRKDECPYYIQIKINTDFISFHRGFCGYKFKKDTK